MNQQNFGKIPLRDVYDERPWEHVSVDLVGPWNLKVTNPKTQQSTKVPLWALTMMDEATGWPEIAPIKEKSAKNVAKNFERAWLCRYPRPARITFDNGGEFLGAEFQKMITSHGIKPVPTTIKNPQANGRHERIHQTMAECIRTFGDIESENSDDVIDQIAQATAWALRSTPRGQTKYSAGQLVFGRDMVVDEPTIANWELVRSRSRAQQVKDNTRENKARTDYEYKKGDLILILTRTNERRGKIDGSAHEGPYEVLRAYKNGTLKILRGRKYGDFEETIHIRRVKLYREKI